MSVPQWLVGDGAAGYHEPVVTAMSAVTAVLDHEPAVLLCTNNYLGLNTDPDVVAAIVSAAQRFGAGGASARFIAGTTEIHVELERSIAELVGTEDAVTFPSASTANHGAITTFSDERTLICSDEFNHASIIDAVKLARAGRKAVFRHNDLDGLSELLQAADRPPNAIVVVDGVFSMEGDLAPLADLLELCAEHDALLIVDDSHATGVIGSRGGGTAEHLGLDVARVGLVTGTLGKALGGSIGGFVAGSTPLITRLRRHARPYIFSNPVPAAMAAAALAAIGRIDAPRLARLREVTSEIQRVVAAAGLDITLGPSAILPVTIGDEDVARRWSERLLAHGVYVKSFAYPIVPKGAARLRLQANAALTDADLAVVAAAFAAVAGELA